MTFSIVACDERHIGVATASHWVAVGGLVPWIRTGAGAVATQAFTNPAHGPDGLAGLASGATPDQALAALVAADAGREFRQVVMIDRRARTAAVTGTACFPYAGSHTVANAAAAGNMLASPEVPRAMTDAFAGASGTLADRLLRALAAGDRAGGDARGRQAAALRVAARATGEDHPDVPLLDLRVDDHADPIGELRRLQDIQDRQAFVADAAFPPEARALLTSDDAGLRRIVEELSTAASGSDAAGAEAALWLALTQLRAGDGEAADATLHAHPLLKPTAQRWLEHLVALPPIG